MIYLLADTYVKARAAVPKFMADSTYETELEEFPAKRRRIAPKRLDSSSEEEVPVRKSKAAIPSAPEVNRKAGKKGAETKTRTTKEGRKEERSELMQRLEKARAAAAQKMAGGSPWKVTPTPTKPSSKKPKVKCFQFLLFLFSFQLFF